MIIYFDFETIPGQAEWVRSHVYDKIEDQIQKLKPPGNYKKQESIDAWLTMEAQKLRSSADETYRRFALDGGYGEIISIAWAENDDEPEVICRGPEDDAMSERELITTWFDAVVKNRPNRLSGAQWIGHNHVGFDFPFLYKRCVVNRIIPPYYMPFGVKPWDDRLYDTMLKWADGGRISQDNLCQILGLPGKPDEIDGSKVYDTWLNGDMELIMDYNQADVRAVQAIHRRMTFKGD